MIVSRRVGDIVIEFRRATIQDVSFILSVRNLDNTRKWLDNTQTFTIEEGESWFKKYNPVFYILNYDDVDIGYFRTSEWASNSLCIGLDLHPDFRGKGLGKESYITMMNYLHKHHGIERFWLKVFSENVVAFNLYKKLGFDIIDGDTFEGRNRLTMELNYNGK